MIVRPCSSSIDVVQKTGIILLVVVLLGRRPRPVETESLDPRLGVGVFFPFVFGAENVAIIFIWINVVVLYRERQI